MELLLLAFFHSTFNTSNLFTFQYGATTIKPDIGDIETPTTFTFQYGATTIISL